MVTITFTKEERKALRKGSILLCVSMPPPWDTGTMGGVRVPTYRNRVVILFFCFNLSYFDLFYIILSCAFTPPSQGNLSLSYIKLNSATTCLIAGHIYQDN